MLESLVGPQVRPSWIKVDTRFLQVTVVKESNQNSSLRCGGKATKTGVKKQNDSNQRRWTQLPWTQTEILRGSRFNRFQFKAEHMEDQGLGGFGRLCFWGIFKSRFIESGSSSSWKCSCVEARWVMRLPEGLPRPGVMRLGRTKSPAASHACHMNLLSCIKSTPFLSAELHPDPVLTGSSRSWKSSQGLNRASGSSQSCWVCSSLQVQYWVRCLDVGVDVRAAAGVHTDFWLFFARSEHEASERFVGFWKIL